MHQEVYEILTVVDKMESCGTDRPLTGPYSQDLFITLEPIPSQGGIPDPEAGEGTSGANVSMLPLSSQSLSFTNRGNIQKFHVDVAVVVGRSWLSDHYRNIGIVIWDPVVVE
ncbi:unnamed protein product [Caretta caretta]